MKHDKVILLVIEEDKVNKNKINTLTVADLVNGEQAKVLKRFKGEEATNLYNIFLGKKGVKQ